MSDENERKIEMGKIFPMNSAEKNTAELALDSLASHMFVTGSTGSGKSNTVYKIIDEAIDNKISFTTSRTSTARLVTLKKDIDELTERS